MAKVSKTFRLDSSTVDRVAAHKIEGESDSAAYARILEAGLDALDGMDPPTYEVPTDAADEHGAGAARAPSPGASGASGDAAVLSSSERDALNAHIATLEEENERLWKQLEAKDQQINQAQQVTALATTAATKKRGLLGWLFGDRRD